jgi:hypothetical protein
MDSYFLDENFSFVEKIRECGRNKHANAFGNLFLFTQCKGFVRLKIGLPTAFDLLLNRVPHFLDRFFIRVD